MRKPKNVIRYLDKDYSSIKELYKAHAADGLGYGIVYQRIRLGWALEKALSEPLSSGFARTFTAQGQIFPALKALAIAAGISYEAAVKRVHRGFSDEEVFSGRRKGFKASAVVKKGDARGKKVSVGGIIYPSLNAAYAAVKPRDLSINTVRARIRYGYSPEEALGVVQRSDGRTLPATALTIEINGSKLRLSEAARKYSVLATTIRMRLARGATPEQAVGLEDIRWGEMRPLAEMLAAAGSSRNKTTYVVDGIEYPSVSALAEAHGISRTLVYNRIRANGWSPERAVKEPVADAVSVNGRNYRSAMNAWEEIGVTSFSTFNSRMLQRQALEVCLGLEPLPSMEKYEIDGRTFSSIAEVAEAHGLQPGQLTYRLRLMSLEEALVYRPANGRYTEARFEADPDLASVAGRFYFVTVTNSEGVLHKVGITAQSVEDRFRAVDFFLLAEYSGRLYDLYRVEQTILNEFKDYHYRGDDDFEGRTETFLLMEDEEKDMQEAIAEAMAEYDTERQF
jgi:hypothetical protein